MKNWILVAIFAAILLVILILFFCKNVYEDYVASKDPKLKELVEKLKIVNPVVDKLKFRTARKSYTVNKKKIYLCMKDEHNEYYNDNTLIYVLLHELAHVLCDEIGHTKKFESIFKSLLVEAEAKNIYNPNIPISYEYCE